MKIQGKTISLPEPELVVIPRKDGDIVFKCQAVVNFERFEQLCPEPKAPIIKYRDGRTKQDFNDRKYLDGMALHNRLYNAYMIIESLSATEGLEWELIDPTNPDTWMKLEEEFSLSGLTPGERAHLVSKVMEANSPSERRLEEAKKRFIQSQAREQENSGPAVEHTTTSSGALANDLE